MNDHSEAFQIFANYWWLIFPIGWAISRVMHMWSRQRQQEKAMDIIKGYADQGKTVPPELLQVLQAPERTRDPVDAQRRDRDNARGLMLASLIFVALSVAFGFLAGSKMQDADPDNHLGLFFITVLMGGFAVAFFVASMLLFRDMKRRDTP